MSHDYEAFAKLAVVRPQRARLVLLPQLLEERLHCRLRVVSEASGLLEALVFDERLEILIFRLDGLEVWSCFGELCCGGFVNVDHGV